jgi:hypothetical protein
MRHGQWLVLISDGSIAGPLDLRETMDRLTLFGLFAVTAMVICYALERRSRWFRLGFAGACVLGSIYGFLQGAWPFGLVEAVWAVIALRRWQTAAMAN